MLTKTFRRNATSRVTPRSLRLEIPDVVGRDWLGNDPFLSRFFESLSMVFPAGERFFMDSVKALRDRVEDPKLQEDVRGFLAQEALHSREHAFFNAWMRRFGIDADAIHEQTAAEINARAGARTPLQNLAVTCALEHFTALLADSWLRNDELRAMAPEELRALWTWHAVEEIEHKAVAFDVYQAAGGDYATRARMMLVATFHFILGTSLLHYALLAAQGQHRNVRNIASGLLRFWGPRGMFTRLIPGYLSYYLPSFHPSQHDQSDLLTRFDAELRKAGYTTPLSRAA